MAEGTSDRGRDARRSLWAAVRDVWLDNTCAGETALRLSGLSMLPTLPHGATVVVRHTRSGIAPGTLIAFRQRGDLIVHRVVAVRRGPSGRLYITRGDNNARSDDPVPESEVLGRVVAVEPSSLDAPDHRSRPASRQWHALSRWLRRR